MTSDNMEPQVVVAPTGATCPVDDATSQRSFLHVEFLTDIDKKESVVRVLAPDAPTGARPAVDVCCVIDISGSMDDRAMVKNESGDKEYHGLNLLDVVKHATRAVTAMLNDDDRMAVVLFTTDARVLLPLTAATKENRERLFAELDTVDPENSTNLWGGLELAMNMLRDRSAVDACRRTGHVLLLTDGQPNVEPPRGHIPTLKRYIEALPNGVAPFMVHTFGFGYSIDTPLLRSIAELMGGLYVFIPDSGLVGTVFVNTASNILCTAATGLTIAVDLGSGRSIVTEHSDPLLVGGQQGVSSSIAHVTLGSVQFGQPRSVYLKWSEDSGKKVESGSGVARVQFTQGGTNSSVVAEEAPVAAGDATRLLQLATERSRAEYLHVMDKLYKLGMEQNLEPAKELLRGCIGRLTNVGSGSPLVAAFIQDLQGEVTATLEATAWTKWGRHYIPSLLRANAVQQCNNFKDHSVQLYGGTYFGVLRDEGEKSFLSVPAPVPKVNRTVRPASGARGLYGNVQAAHNGVAAAAAPAAAAPRANMRAYYNRSGGCITPESLVQLHDGAWIAAATVSKGMCLANGATVRCVVRIPLTQRTPMVQLNEHLCITEYHPVRVAGGTWQFPVDCLGGRRVLRDDVSEVYTYILEGGAAVPAAGNVEVVALGHGLTDNDVVRHEYLGTQRVVEDLMQLEGFHSVGMVTVGAFVRNPISQRIEGMERGALIPAVSA